MKIGWWDAGNLDNQYCGNDGGSNLRIPLLKQLNGHGHTIYAEMADPGNYEYSEVGLWEIEDRVGQEFVDECYRFRESLDFVIERELKPGLIGQLDAVIIEARREDMEEFKRSVQVARTAIDSDAHVFLFDRNNWAQQYPDDIPQNTYLLRPYYQANEVWPDSYQVFFPYFFRRDVPETSLDVEYDLVYIGNRYGREEQMDKFLEGLEDLDILVCGNWPDKDQEVTEKYDFDFVGSTPHFATIPTLRLGKASFHVGKPDYNELGMLTLRPFEAKTAGRPCFINSDINHINELVENHRWATNKADWVKTMLDKTEEQRRKETGSNFNRTAREARVQLEKVIRDGP